ncbi:MAG: Gx transporter family protein [Peptococcaceae bacterium]|nr:Gx transporter family protein [Peptococcaceae bacterium]
MTTRTRTQSRTQKLTRLALLTTIALIIFIVEAQIPPLTAVPGVKMGLANIITLVTLYLYGPKEALSVLLMRIFLGSIFAGQMMVMLFSLAGGLLCFAVSVVLYRFLPLSKLWLLSMIGAVCHNIGQVGMAMLVMQTPEIVWYLPMLLVSGIVSGIFTGLVASYLLRRLDLAQTN